MKPPHNVPPQGEYSKLLNDMDASEGYKVKGQTIFCLIPVATMATVDMLDGHRPNRANN